MSGWKYEIRTELAAEFFIAHEIKFRHSKTLRGYKTHSKKSTGTPELRLINNHLQIGTHSFAGELVLFFEK